MCEYVWSGCCVVARSLSVRAEGFDVWIGVWRRRRSVGAVLSSSIGPKEGWDTEAHWEYSLNALCLFATKIGRQNREEIMPRERTDLI